MLAVGLWIIVLGLADASLAVFILGTVIGGFGVGLVYGASLALAKQLAPPDHLAHHSRNRRRSRLSAHR